MILSLHPAYSRTLAGPKATRSAWRSGYQFIDRSSGRYFTIRSPLPEGVEAIHLHHLTGVAVIRQPTRSPH